VPLLVAVPVPEPDPVDVLTAPPPHPMHKGNRAEVRNFQFGDVAVDFERPEVSKAGRPLTLAGKELQLLRYLVNHRDRVVPREEILQQVWEYDSAVSSRTMDVHIAWLRQKLDNFQNPRFIQTVRGKGYRFNPST
jgi:two-component system alkaline phosphatase synthesis response regulator PhoP